MLSVSLKKAIRLTSEEPELNELAKKILADLDVYLKGARGFFVKMLVRKVKKRFEKDRVDEATFGYIISRLLKDFDALDDLYEIFSEVLSGEKKEKADQIVEDIRSVLKGRVLKTFTKENAADDFVRSFETMIIDAGVERSKAVDLAKMVWDEVQKRFGV